MQQHVERQRLVRLRMINWTVALENGSGAAGCIVLGTEKGFGEVHRGALGAHVAVVDQAA